MPRRRRPPRVSVGLRFRGTRRAERDILLLHKRFSAFGDDIDRIGKSYKESFTSAQERTKRLIDELEELKQQIIAIQKPQEDMFANIKSALSEHQEIQEELNQHMSKQQSAQQQFNKSLTNTRDQFIDIGDKVLSMMDRLDDLNKMKIIDSDSANEAMRILERLYNQFFTLSELEPDDIMFGMNVFLESLKREFDELKKDKIFDLSVEKDMQRLLDNIIGYTTVFSDEMASVQKEFASFNLANAIQFAAIQENYKKLQQSIQDTQKTLTSPEFIAKSTVDMIDEIMKSSKETMPDIAKIMEESANSFAGGIVQLMKATSQLIPSRFKKLHSAIDKAGLSIMKMHIQTKMFADKTMSKIIKQFQTAKQIANKLAMPIISGVRRTGRFFGNILSALERIPIIGSIIGIIGHTIGEAVGTIGEHFGETRRYIQDLRINLFEPRYLNKNLQYGEKIVDKYFGNIHGWYNRTFKMVTEQPLLSQEQIREMLLVLMREGVGNVMDMNDQLFNQLFGLTRLYAIAGGEVNETYAQLLKGIGIFIDENKNMQADVMKGFETFLGALSIAPDRAEEMLKVLTTELPAGVYAKHFKELATTFIIGSKAGIGFGEVMESVFKPLLQVGKLEELPKVLGIIFDNLKAGKDIPIVMQEIAKALGVEPEGLTQLQSFLQQLADRRINIKEFGDEVQTLLQRFSLPEYVKKLADDPTTYFMQLKNAFSAAFQGIAQQVAQHWIRLFGKIMKAPNKLKAAIELIIKPIITLVTSGIKIAIKSAWRSIAELFRDIMKAIANALSTAGGWVGKHLSMAFDNVSKMFDKSASAAGESIDSIRGEIDQASKSLFGVSLSEAIDQIGDAAKAIKGSNVIEPSPARPKVPAGTPTISVKPTTGGALDIKPSTSVVRQAQENVRSAENILSTIAMNTGTTSERLKKLDDIYNAITTMNAYLRGLNLKPSSGLQLP